MHVRRCTLPTEDEMPEHNNSMTSISYTDKSISQNVKIIQTTQGKEKYLNTMQKSRKKAQKYIYVLQSPIYSIFFVSLFLSQTYSHLKL